MNKKQRGFILLFTFIILLFPILIEAKSGCCSSHGGVRTDGCGCNDGTSLSATCAPYYSCKSSSSSNPPLTYNYTSNENKAITPTENKTTAQLNTILVQNVTNTNKIAPVKTDKKIKIANWNLNTFGPKKASNNGLMSQYASIIDDYDIIFIQEIRDISGNSFKTLCNSLPDYNCKISSRAGRWFFYKEQYGIIYKKNITIANFTDYNPDKQNRWERPPIKILFNISGYILTAYNIHTKPSDVKIELSYLERIASNSGNVIVLGDLNADCGYYKKRTEFISWNWIIGDDEDTTVSSSNCAYERIIMNADAYNEYVSKGIYKQITKDMSDHYLVWVEIKTG